MKSLPVYLILYLLTVAIFAGGLYFASVFPDSWPLQKFREFCLWLMRLLGRDV